MRHDIRLEAKMIQNLDARLGLYFIIIFERQYKEGGTTDSGITFLVTVRVGI